MRKIWVIACREYRAAVRSKAFVITMVLMPVLMGASIGIQVLFKKLEDTKEKKYVVIDRTGGQLAASLQLANDLRNRMIAANPEAAKNLGPKYAIEIVTPSENDRDAIGRQRFELSQRIEKEEIDGVLEIGPKVFQSALQLGADPEKVDDAQAVRFQAKNIAQSGFRRWADLVINEAVQANRIAPLLKKGEASVPEVKLIQAERVTVKGKALTKLDPQTGKYEDGSSGAQIANFFLPGVLIGLMFMVIMVGATPAMQGIVEEKSQRIAEVLLGSVSPFQLMAGKLLGVIGVSLTMASVYFVGGYIVADRYDVADMLTPGLMIWFAVFLIMSLLIFGSLFIAVGAAAGDIKDTQTLLMPIMLIACLPFFALGPIMQDPNGKIAVICSFFPFATPMLLVARQSVPPGVPLWQMISGIALVLTTTIFCVWAAGRIFRIGILMQGKGAKFSDIVRWVVKG
jgi:ABC-2 type transport system permease protein